MKRERGVGGVYVAQGRFSLKCSDIKCKIHCNLELDSHELLQPAAKNKIHLNFPPHSDKRYSKWRPITHKTKDVVVKN